MLGLPDGNGPDRNEALVFSSYQTCLDVAERGEGIALGWERSVQPRLEAGALVRLAGITVADAAVINTYTPRSAPNPLADELRALLEDAFAPRSRPGSDGTPTRDRKT